MNSFENNQLIAEFLGFQSTDIGWYYAEDLEAWNDSIGKTENFCSLERVFEDNDYVNLLEKFVTKSIINS